jgi:DNA repair protein RecO (recombination protein O)
VAVIKDVGVVLREMKVGENNKRLVLLTRGRGKIAVFARGSGKAVGRLSVSKLTFYEFVAFDGGQFLSLNQVSSIKAFGNIASCYNSFCVAVFFLELLEKTLYANMDSQDALKLLLFALGRLDKGHDCGLVFAAFVFKFLQMEGFEPVVLDSEDSWFFGEEGAQPKSEGAVELSREGLMALKYILGAEIGKVFGFRASKDVVEGLGKAAVLFLEANLDVELKSLAMLQLYKA